MLPWRVQFQDPVFRRQILTGVVVLALIIGAFTQGFSVTLTMGDREADGQRVASRAGSPAAGTGSGSGFGAGDEALEGVSGDGASDASPTGDPGTGPAPAVAGTGPSRSARTTSPGGGATNSGETAGPAVVGAAANDPCQGATLRDNDQGVTKDTIKLGVLIADLGPLGQAGFNVGVSGDYPKMLKAWGEELNRNGGVACRKVTFVTASFDVLSVDDMIAKCKFMTQDQKVHAVLTAGGYDSVAQLCIARDNKTPFLNPEAEPADWYREAAPYLWNMLMSKDRMHRNHVKYLADAKTITPATKIGVIYHGIPNVAPSVEKAMLPELAAAKIQPLRVTKLSSDSEQALAQINQAVVDFQTAGVEFVFMPMNLIFKTQFMQQAEKQNYYPEYTDSDHYYGCFDFVTNTYPAASWDRTTCVTSNSVFGRADLEDFTNKHPWAQHADAVYKRANPEGYDEAGEKDEDEANAQRALHITIGSLIALWEQAADRAGPDLTRAKWGAAMGQTGQFDKHVGTVPLTFGPEKWDGPDHIAVVQWHAEAGGGFEERRYRQIKPAFNAYF